MIRSPLLLAPLAGLSRLVGLAGLFGLTACSTVDGEPRPDPALAGPAVKVVGEAESCINRTAVRSTIVRSDQVIDFEMAGGRVYRNVLGRKCPRLGFERSFTYNATGNQICRPEIIFVLDTIGGRLQRGAGCGLGEFVPVEYLENSSDE
jgi:hypothetical protein